MSIFLSTNTLAALQPAPTPPPTPSPQLGTGQMPSATGLMGAPDEAGPVGMMGPVAPPPPPPPSDNGVFGGVGDALGGVGSYIGGQFQNNPFLNPLTGSTGPGQALTNTRQFLSTNPVSNAVGDPLVKFASDPRVQIASQAIFSPDILTPDMPVPFGVRPFGAPDAPPEVLPPTAPVEAPQPNVGAIDRLGLPGPAVAPEPVPPPPTDATVPSGYNADPALADQPFRSPEQVQQDIQAAYQRSLGNTAPLDTNTQALDPVSNLLQRITDAKPLQEQNQELLSQFRSRQAGAFSGALSNSAGGETGARQAMAAMRGAAERVTFQPLRDAIGQSGVDQLNDVISSHPDLRPFEKAQAFTALGDIMDGQVPTPSSLASLEQAFPGITKSLQSANIIKGPTIWQRIPTSLSEVGNSIRSSNTLLDFAFMGRLGPQAGLMQPGTFVRAVGQAWKSIADPEIVRNVWDNLDEAAAASRGELPTIDEMRTDYGLKAFTSDTNPGLLGQVPGVGRLAKVYQNFQALLRPQMLQQEIQNRLDAGALTPQMLQDPTVTKDLGRSINLLTGASSLNIGDDSNLLLEFPNWLAAQGELIFRAATNGNITGQMARQSLARLGAFGLATTTAINAAQGRGPLDGARNGVPMARVPDAVAKRIGLKPGTTVDMFGPLGELVSKTVGVGAAGAKGAQTGGLSGALGGTASELGYQARSFASPLASLGIDIATKTNFLGQPLRTGWDWLQDGINHVAPFAVSTALEGGRSPAAQGLGSAGFRLHEPSTAAQLKAGTLDYAGLSPADQFKQIPAQSWTLIVDHAPGVVKADVGQYQNVYDWYAAKQAEYAKGWEQRGMPPAEAQLRAEASVQANPIYKAYLNAKNHTEDEWYGAHPTEGQAYLEGQMKLPPSERKNLPTRAQMDIIAHGLAK